MAADDRALQAQPFRQTAPASTNKDLPFQGQPFFIDAPSGPATGATRPQVFIPT